jgi:hypothetical protein
LQEQQLVCNEVQLLLQGERFRLYDACRQGLVMAGQAARQGQLSPAAKVHQATAL